MPEFVKKRTLILEIVVIAAVLAGAYYFYLTFSEQDALTAPVQVNEQLLGTNITLFLKSKTQDRLSFREVSFINSRMVMEMQDFTETISTTLSRGRVDPFIPYASSRSIR